MAIKETPLPSISNPATDETTYYEEIEKGIRREFIRCVDPRALFCYVPDLLSNAEEERVEACQKEHGQTYAARMLLQLVSRRKDWVSVLMHGLRHEEVRLQHLADKIQQLEGKYIKVLRLVIVGQSGRGKSASGNTILGKDDAFHEIAGFLPPPVICEWDSTLFDDTFVEVTDTPGVYFMNKEEVLNSMNKACLLMAPGPHALLLVVRGNGRFTGEDEAAYNEVKSYFGPDMIKHMIVIFTCTDYYERYPVDFNKMITTAPEALKYILREADNRWIGFNNKANMADRRTQAKKLITMVIDLVRRNNYSYYSTPQMKRYNELMTSMEHEKRLTRREINTRIVRNEIDISEDAGSRLSGILSDLVDLASVFISSFVSRKRWK